MWIFPFSYYMLPITKNNFSGSYESFYWQVCHRRLFTKYFAKENHIIHVQISYSANDCNITQKHCYIFICYGNRLRSQSFKHSHSLQIMFNQIRVGESYFSNSICYYKLYILTSDTLVYVDDITTITISYNWQPPNTERYSQFVFVFTHQCLHIGNIERLLIWVRRIWLIQTVWTYTIFYENVLHWNINNIYYIVWWSNNYVDIN